MAEQASDASLEGYAMSADAIKYGADLQYKAAQEAIAAQMDMYNQTREDQMPWLKSGRKALKTLNKMVSAGPGEFTESPGYQFRLDQGNKNMLGAASATGNLASGRTLKALEEYGQDYASNEYQNFLNQYYTSLTPYQSLAGVGLNAAQSIGSAGIATGQGIASTYNALGASQANSQNNLANIYAGMGGAQASGYMNAGNAIANNYMGQADISAQNTINKGNIWTNAINQGLSVYGMWAGNKAASSGSQAAMPYSNSTSWSNPSNYNLGYNISTFFR